MLDVSDWATITIDGHKVTFSWDDDEDAMTARCPLCGGLLRWVNYDDGDGSWDTAVRCEHGDVDTWL